VVHCQTLDYPRHEPQHPSSKARCSLSSEHMWIFTYA